jgi:hypothetical protein
MVTARLSRQCKEAGREVALEGINCEMRVKGLLRIASKAFGVPLGVKVALLYDSRLLRAEETLAEAGIYSGNVVGFYVGDGGGMPGHLPSGGFGTIPGLVESDESSGGTKRMRTHFDNLSNSILSLETSLLELEASLKITLEVNRSTSPTVAETLDVEISVGEDVQELKQYSNANVSRIDESSKQVERLGLTDD